MLMYSKYQFFVCKVLSVLISTGFIVGLMLHSYVTVAVSGFCFAVLSLVNYLIIDSFMAGMDAKDTMMEEYTRENAVLTLRNRALEDKVKNLQEKIDVKN